MGKVAIANAKMAYQSFKRIFSGPAWAALAGKGAMVQRVLWASTGTKNPAYRDVIYIEELIGRDTVNTVPPDTLSAFRDHGRPRPSLEEDLDGARAILDGLEQSGVSLSKATSELLEDGLKKFVEPFTKLLKAVERRCREANKARINGQSHKLPEAQDAEVKKSSPSGTRKAVPAGSSRPTRRSGRAPTRRAGWDGSASWTPRSTHCPPSTPCATR